MATERKIGAHVYRCDKLPAEDALDMLLRVSAFFAAYPEAIGSISSNSPEKEAPAAMLALAMAGVNGDETKKMLMDLVQGCRVNGEPCIVGVKPAELIDFLAVAWFAMEVNFKDFLLASVRNPSGAAAS